MPRPQWTPEQARAASAKGHEAKRQRKARLATAAALAALQPMPDEPLADDYVKQRLACVRAQLGRIDAMLLAETDPQRLDRLAAACARLSEVERQLAGRPAPGAYRPAAPRRRAADVPALVPE